MDETASGFEKRRSGKMKIIIIGCGRVGAGLANALSARSHDVTIVDHDVHSFERLGAGFKGKTVLGLGFEKDILIQAGVEKADALAAVLDGDDENVVIARVAKVLFRVPRVAARIYDPRKADIYRQFGLQIVSPVSLAIAKLMELMTFTQMATTTEIGTGEVENVTWEVTEKMIGKTIASLNVSGEINVISLTRNGKTSIPFPGTVLQKNDLLQIAVLATSSDRFRKMID
jgi:trk system potassium uptake protein TrkA